MKDLWLWSSTNTTGIRSSTNSSFLIASPYEDQKIQNPQNSVREGVYAGVQAAATAGAQAAATAGAVTAVPVLVGCRYIPWARKNLNYTAQALIISAASIAAFFITADKTILRHARNNAQYDKRT